MKMEEAYLSEMLVSTYKTGYTQVLHKSPSNTTQVLLTPIRVTFLGVLNRHPQALHLDEQCTILSHRRSFIVFI
jgi:hypothetical protein